ncbi:hypothetical protein CHLNCDRAFT_143630 [Chlorella variabilis]|uniref:Uncharacterized protein n=1 Tax=Chlorella variabilis TaxID=554065 RepID=E1ZA51_CHLVA|nr:hypothetical protein CHLNCDRAFT_143630 [Chlorella variabilis]EFN57205.1 hypothetical protein CHLNCDRAFT_143630 [Chlorella variabilis]|eukprot:XP_005849307.1 hypothetical protein CHLNCDRAFT_143630 [Chlorella variabilis]
MSGGMFHYARGITWCVVLLRALAVNEWAASVVIAIGTVTTVLPAFAPSLLGESYTGWRVPIQVFDNLLQVSLGCFTHQYIYPDPKGGAQPSTFQAGRQPAGMATVLLTGSGPAWLQFSSLWGSLPFKRRLRRLAPLALLRAYHRLLVPVAAGRTCSAAVLAAPKEAAEAVRAACMASATATATAAAAAAAARSAALQAAAGSRAAAAATAAAGAELCLQYQPLSLLLLGFLLPTLYIWVTELRLRCAFFAQRCRRAGQGSAAASEGQRSLRALGTLPTLGDYCMYCVPAVAAMYMYIVVHG